MTRGSRISWQSRQASGAMTELARSRTGRLVACRSRFHKLDKRRSERVAPLFFSGFRGSRRGQGSGRKRRVGLELRRAIPIEGAPQALFKRNGRLVTEKFAGLRDVRLRVTNIAVARRFIFHLEALAGDLV